MQNLKEPSRDLFLSFLRIVLIVGVLFLLFCVIFLKTKDLNVQGPANSIYGRYRSGMMAINLQENSTYQVLSLEPITNGISTSELMTKNLEDLPTKDSILETGTYTNDGKWITFSGHYLDFPDHRIEIQGNWLVAYSYGKGDRVVYSKKTP
jgi:hypothetical protein